MRALVACLAVVAAIALPGVIVAATHSSSSLTSRVADYTPQTQIVPGKAPSGELMDVSAKVEAALEAKGLRMQLFGAGPNEAQLVEERGGNCPVQVTFQEWGTGAITFENPCGTGVFEHGHVRITYSPPSIGPTVKRAVANLR